MQKDLSKLFCPKKFPPKIPHKKSPHTYIYYDYIAAHQVKALFLSVSVTIKSDGAVKNFYIGLLLVTYIAHLSHSKIYFINYKTTQLYLHLGPCQVPKVNSIKGLFTYIMSAVRGQLKPIWPCMSKSRFYGDFCIF